MRVLRGEPQPEAWHRASSWVIYSSCCVSAPFAAPIAPRTAARTKIPHKKSLDPLHCCGFVPEKDLEEKGPTAGLIFPPGRLTTKSIPQALARTHPDPNPGKDLKDGGIWGQFMPPNHAAHLWGAHPERAAPVPGHHKKKKTGRWGWGRGECPPAPFPMGASGPRERCC